MQEILELMGSLFIDYVNTTVQVGQVSKVKCYHRKLRITILNSNYISQGQKRRI
jgi:hypothetical protein